MLPNRVPPLVYVDNGARITEAFPAPGAARPPAQPSGSSRPVRGTGRAELSGFGNARYVKRHPLRCHEQIDKAAGD